MTADQQRDLEELRRFLESTSREESYWVKGRRTELARDAERWLAALDALRAEKSLPAPRAGAQ